MQPMRTLAQTQGKQGRHMEQYPLQRPHCRMRGIMIYTTYATTAINITVNRMTKEKSKERREK